MPPLKTCLERNGRRHKNKELSEKISWAAVQVLVIWLLVPLAQASAINNEHCTHVQTRKYRNNWSGLNNTIYRTGVFNRSAKSDVMSMSN